MDGLEITVKPLTPATKGATGITIPKLETRIEQLDTYGTRLDNEMNIIDVGIKVLSTRDGLMDYINLPASKWNEVDPKQYFQLNTRQNSKTLKKKVLSAMENEFNHQFYEMAKLWSLQNGPLDQKKFGEKTWPPYFIEKLNKWTKEYFNTIQTYELPFSESNSETLSLINLMYARIYGSKEAINIIKKIKDSNKTRQDLEIHNPRFKIALKMITLCDDPKCMELPVLLVNEYIDNSEKSSFKGALPLSSREIEALRFAVGLAVPSVAPRINHHK